MGDFRDIQHGVNDPVDGVDVKRRFNDNQTPHERAQSAADVRSSAIPASDEEFLPEALRRRRRVRSIHGPVVVPPRKQNRFHAQFANSIDYRGASAGDSIQH